MASRGIPSKQSATDPSLAEALLFNESLLNQILLTDGTVEEIIRRASTALLRAMPYDVYLQTEHWAMLRRHAFEAWGKRCHECGSETRPIHLHHTSYEHRGTVEEIGDVVPLCEDCHATVHGIMPNGGA